MKTKSSGINLMFSNLNLRSSVFDMKYDQIVAENVANVLSAVPGNDKVPQSFFMDHILPNISYNNLGGFLFVGQNSSVISENNEYGHSRSNRGGCVALLGSSEVKFTNDTFIGCSAVTGGAIYANNFFEIDIKNCSFKDNTALSTKGENIYAERFGGLVNISNSTFQSD